MGKLHPAFSCRDSGTGLQVMHGLPVPAAVSEVLSLLKLRLHQGTADTGVAVSVHPVGEPRARDADLGGVAALDHAVVSVAPFLHCFHDVRLSTPVLLLGSRRRQRGMKKGGFFRPALIRLFLRVLRLRIRSSAERELSDDFPQR